MSEAVSQVSGRVAAIYARVSSEGQREQRTIASQLAGLREHAAGRGLLIADELVFCDEGFSGATLIRPALERLRDRAAEGCFEVLLCHAPDRLARRYAYQVLLLEELARAGVEVVFARGAERSGSPEDELLRQFHGMIAEYERAQIRERTRRGKLHRARTGQQAVMAGAPYGYRFVKKTDIADGHWEIDESEALVVREIFRRYAEDGCSIGELARWPTGQGIPTGPGKRVRDRSTVWGMLRTPAYRGQAAYGKTKVADHHGKPTRTPRARGERRGRRQVRVDEPVEQWLFIPVPPLVTDEIFALAQERLHQNAHFAKRNTRQPGPLQGLVVCRECGYGCYRTSTRTAKRKIVYYRCTGQDNWRHPGGRVCHSRPIRADELEPLVWGEVRQLLENPALVRAEIDRRLQALRTEHPAARRREAIDRAADRGLPRTAHLARRAARADAHAAQAPDHAASSARRAQRRAPRRRNLPPARRHTRELPRPPRRRTGPAQHRRATAHPAARRPRSARRRRLRHDHDPPRDPDPERRPQRKLPIAWEQSAHRCSQTSRSTSSMRRGRRAGGGWECWSDTPTTSSSSAPPASGPTRPVSWRRRCLGRSGCDCIPRRPGSCTSPEAPRASTSWAFTTRCGSPGSDVVAGICRSGRRRERWPRSEARFVSGPIGATHTCRWNGPSRTSTPCCGAGGRISATETPHGSSPRSTPTSTSGWRCSPAPSTAYADGIGAPASITDG